MLEKQKEPSASEPMSTSHLSNQLAKEATLQNTAGKYNHDFDWNNKRVLDVEKNWKTRIIKEAIYSEENKHHVNGILFKLPAIWEPILQKNKEKKRKLENSTAKNTSPLNPCPVTSATQTNQSAMTTEHFDPPAST